MDENNAIWNVVYVASRREKTIAKLFEKEGFDFYLPIIKKLSQWSDRKKWIEVPLFSGYVFINLKNSNRDNVLKIPGVVKFVKVGSRDALIKQKEINDIKEFIARGYNIEELSKNEHFEEGNMVKIIQGPWRNRIAQVFKADNKNYVFLMLEGMGTAAKIQMLKHMIRIYKE